MVCFCLPPVVNQASVRLCAPCHPFYMEHSFQLVVFFFWGSFLMIMMPVEKQQCVCTRRSYGMVCVWSCYLFSHVPTVSQAWLMARCDCFFLLFDPRYPSSLPGGFHPFCRAPCAPRSWPCWPPPRARRALRCCRAHARSMGCALKGPSVDPTVASGLWAGRSLSAKIGHFPHGHQQHNLAEHRAA